MLRAEQKYEGQVVAADWTESSKGTTGFSISIETPDGDQITHVFWITPKSQESFIERMERFGHKREQFSNGSYLTHQFPGEWLGRAVSFGTVEEEYKGERKIKVGWVGPKSAPSDPRGIGYGVAALFGGEAKPQSKPGLDPGAFEDDIPF